MRPVIYILVITKVVTVTAAQGSSCPYKDGCTPQPDVCSVPPPACLTGWSGTFCQMRKLYNIARGKPASQSSTWTDDTGTYDAGKAVDGDVSTDWGHGSCSHTNEINYGNASWHVFLNGTFLVSRITIYLRQDSIRNYQAMEVLVNNKTCRELPVKDIRDPPDHLLSNPMTLSCTQPIEGDTVSVVMAGPFLALCEVQVFGEKKESCHCSNGCSDFPSTACSTLPPGPVCIPPWFGRFCQMENIAFQKTATQSSNYSDGGIHYCAAYAVDGNTDTDISYRSCSHTNEPVGGTASWQVLLDDQQMFNISRIRIYLRRDFWDHNQDMNVLVDGDLCNSVSGTTIDGTHGSVTNPINVTCTHVMKGKTVAINMSGQFLTLCEVQVFVCSDGWFDSDCDKQCQCLDPSEVCDKETGYCPSGCAAGKQGPGCQQVCTDGWFGYGCGQQCHCLDPSEVCDKETGDCRGGCAAGKQGTGCQQDCGQHFYGVNCSSKCGQCLNLSDCKKDNGTCTQGCERGYRAPYCKDCEEGRHGADCSQLCGSCKDGGPCNTTTGVCTQGCADHFAMPDCKSCSDGWFGSNCGEQCKCRNESEVCDKTNGNCKSGCHAGKTGSGCQDDCGPGLYGINCSSTCGHCRGATDCKKDDGNCTQGCQTGYHLPLCQDCVEGRHGVNCSQLCGSCKDGGPCNTTTGVCAQGCVDHFAMPDCKYCDAGHYGFNCSSTCGHCRDTSGCRKEDGNCTDGCKVGFSPPLCKACSDRWFGTNCGEQCNCQNETEVCNKNTGECASGCLAGKTGIGCQEACSDGWFGTNCGEKCFCQNETEVCNKTTGECASGCHAGKTGDGCQEVCSDGSFGTNCNEKCLCQNETEACDKTTGNCTSGCRAGKMGTGCQEACTDGWFGTNCGEKCYCQNETEVCDKATGKCRSGCHAGKTGDGCQEEAQTGNKPGGPQSMTGIIVGVLVGVFSVAVFVAVLVFIRRRRSFRKSLTEEQQEEDTTESSFSSVSTNTTASQSSKPAKPVKPSKKPTSPANHMYENTDTYYNALPTPVPLERLRRYVRQRVAGAGFEQEYKLLPHGLTKEHKEGEKPDNKKRNRFIALFPYDESRVVLAPDGDATCDYIHASYVQGFHEAKVFIAAQGPNKVTVDDFWRMIWQEHVSLITMLTRVMELNRKKCEQYWPEGTKDKKCGNILIKPLLSTVRADFTIRKFLVQHSKMPSDKRTVTQLHFTSWPDHDVPSAPALVGCWKQYRSLTSSEEDITGPVVVHCSAGVGRTGTFIALDNLFDEAESLNKVNVFTCVSKLREARMNMVQTVEQYRFVHESVMEAIESRGTFYTLSDFEGKFGTGLKYSRQQDVELNKQFQSLESMKMEIPEKLSSDAYLPENISKNRNKNIVPANRGRPFLSTPATGRTDYINAVILPSATQPLGLMATQTPLKDTVVDFWRLVFDHDCFTIVCLEDEAENQAIYPRKNESLNIGPFRLTTLKEDTSRDTFTEMELNLTLREQDNTLHQINVFKLKSQIPGPTEPMLEFVNEIGRKGSSEEHKTLVHCLDGARLCGVFCSVLNIITRLRLDKEVDIYLTIRELQCIRPQFIQSYDQYKFCYDLVKEYLRDSSMYANM